MNITPGIKNLLQQQPFIVEILVDIIQQHNEGLLDGTTELDMLKAKVLNVLLSGWWINDNIKILVVTQHGSETPQILLPAEYQQIENKIREF